MARRTRWVVLLVLLLGGTGGLFLWRGGSEETRYTPEQLVQFVVSSSAEGEIYVLVEARVPAGYRNQVSRFGSWQREEREPTLTFKEATTSETQAYSDCPDADEPSGEGMLKLCSSDKEYSIMRIIYHGGHRLSCQVTLQARRGEEAEDTWSGRQRRDWMDVCRSFRIVRGVSFERRYQPNIPTRFELPVYVDGVRNTAVLEAMLPATYRFEKRTSATLELRAQEDGERYSGLPTITFWSQRLWPGRHASPGQASAAHDQPVAAQICRVPEHPELTSYIVSHERTDDRGELAACSLRLDPQGDKMVALAWKLAPHGEQEIVQYLRKSLPVGESRLRCEVQLRGRVREALSNDYRSWWTEGERNDFLDVCRSLRLLEVREAQP